jgi:hypothetical protein
VSAAFAASPTERADRVHAGWRVGILAATRATLVRGRWSVLALAAFLVRGGILLVLLPIVVLPSPAELSGLTGPTFMGGGLQSPTPLLVMLVAVTSLVLVTIVLVTTVLGTWLEVELIAAMELDEAFTTVRGSRPRARIGLGPAIEARLATHLPTAVALVAGLVVLTGAATDEMLSPQGTGPLVVRILLRAPLVPIAVVLAWLLGETWAGLAIRHLAVVASVRAALRRGLRDLVRPSAIGTLLATSIVVGLLVLALWAAVGHAFARLPPLLTEPSEPAFVLIALGLLVGTWAASLWLLGIGLAWRSAAWTAEVLRRS